MSDDGRRITDIARLLTPALDLPTFMAMTGTSPVGWANAAIQRSLVAALLPLRNQPVLIISMPRSGSSWVGDVMGNSPQAMYLREPLTQSYLDANERSGLSFRWFEEGDIPAAYEEGVAAIRKGTPVFGGSIVRHVDQWRISTRLSGRVVVKEVNPFALPWLIEQLNPIVLYLIRHPAAVAASFERMGWSAALSRRLPAAMAPAPSNSEWVDRVRLQGVALRQNVEVIHEYPNAHIVLYEDLCRDPLGVFADLYDFAGLTWTPATEMHVERRSASGEIDDAPYPVSQPSEQMIDAWRNLVPPSELGRMREAWIETGLPFYPAECW